MADTKRQIERAVDDLREYHAMGWKSLEDHPKRVPYGNSSELLRKARVFAARYASDDPETLIDRCEVYRHALGRSLIDRLATVHDKEERNGLELEAIQKRWSKAALDREIRKRYGSRHRQKGLGRTPARPMDVDDALSELSRLSAKLTRWFEMMQPDDANAENRTTLNDLPKSIRENTKDLIPRLRKLQKTLETRARRRRKQDLDK